ncbi:unnamed protein product [Auanema sp. JU1783]|nr:unnamed protein product [Auanema sp. JU1783]
MSRRFNSDQASSLYKLYLNVKTSIEAKMVSYEGDTRAVLAGSLRHYVAVLDNLIHRPSVRGSRDSSLRTPEVNEDWTISQSLKRMKYQVKAICLIIDPGEADPPTSREEDELSITA